MKKKVSVEDEISPNDQEAVWILQTMMMFK